MLGSSAIGQLLRAWFPAWQIEPAAFALVGMAGFFSGVSKTPLASIIMVCEMAGSYSLLVPLMLVCGLNLLLSRRWTLYEEQVPSPIDSPAHLGDFVIDVLERLRVSDIRVRSVGIEHVPQSTPFNLILNIVANSGETLFPVMDSEGRMTGIFSLRDVRLALAGSSLGPLVLADDLARRPVLTVTPADDPTPARRNATPHRDSANVEEIPVVSPDEPTRLQGLLSRRDLVAAYTAQIEALRSQEGRETG